MNEGEHLLWMPAVVQVFLFFAVPAVLLAAADRVRIVQWLSPAFFCYLAGIAMALVPGFPVYPALTAPISAAGIVLSQLTSKTTPSIGWPRIISSVSMAARLR